MLWNEMHPLWRPRCWECKRFTTMEREDSWFPLMTRCIACEMQLRASDLAYQMAVSQGH